MLYMVQVGDEPMTGHGTCLPDQEGPQPAEAVELTEEEIKKSAEDFKVCHHPAITLGH